MNFTKLGKLLLKSNNVLTAFVELDVKYINL